MCKSLSAAGRYGICRVSETLNSINNNVGRKINIGKRVDLGAGELTCSVRSPDVDPYSRCGTQLVPINVRRGGGLSNLEDAKLEQLIDEFRVEGTLHIDVGHSLSGSVSVDVPKTVKFATASRGGIFNRGVVNFADTLKRLDFVYRNANLVFHAAYNQQSGESTVELLKRLEDLYVVYDKYVHVTPKLELVLDGGLSAKSNFCLGIQRGKDSITPIIYPLTRKFEVLAEKTVTEGLKAGFFWSKDKRLYLNLSLSMPWGANGWQTVAFRFVFPEVLRSHVHVLNEVQLP
ncbi:uncharacterized protein BcabD6B2_54920 [Babesia caballi]|uniref:Membrane protein, putative n=1 Tax=Babesia caballi TaxID=5871 RepID=A0AAV4M3X7_BABCB|nr:membrane protein, putative [Babesia caballi]